MFLEWFPWKYIVRNIARRQGFVDPIKVLAQIQNFAQPSEVLAPTELLRLGVLLHARGYMNSLAIQHNLDWVWPYWVECQYNPNNEAFVPRSFALTQINLTHRNWTAVGLPDCGEYPIVDPRGLVTPFYDGWSIDAWIIPDEGPALLPSRASDACQRLDIQGNLCVTTQTQQNRMQLQTAAQMIGSPQLPVCQIQINADVPAKGWLVVCLRPYHPEGVSFINEISLLDNRMGWCVNKTQYVHLDTPPDQCSFSYYRHGDVYGHLPSKEDKTRVECKVGMATAAALYRIEQPGKKQVTVEVPLFAQPQHKECATDAQTAALHWTRVLDGHCRLQVPDKNFQFLYDTAIRTMVLHCPREVYPGPFVYRRFWFRDAAFILHAMLCVGFESQVRRALDCFRGRQNRDGYFLSQEGEWDSNGEALWIMRKYCELTNTKPPQEWKESILKGGRWISKKRLADTPGLAHSGLLPAGFSAEHLGPNDYYYWDDFWGVAGLEAAAFLSRQYKDEVSAAQFTNEARQLSEAIDRSLYCASKHLPLPMTPASPYRRMDSGAIGSLAGQYPLQLWDAKDSRTLNTVDFLLKNCLVHNGFFHDMTHSGINPYLTLHLAQVLLRAGDGRWYDLVKAVADLASPTGQWPEAIHPRVKGGCMGDGQHVWAAAEWVLMLRNCFVREEGNKLVLCSGIPRQWLDGKTPLFFGPAQTSFGEISITVTPGPTGPEVSYKGNWFGPTPQIEVMLK